MKIAYLANHEITTNDGVTKKICGQIKEWKKNGHSVKVFCSVKVSGDSILENSKQYIFKSPYRLRFFEQKDLLYDLEVYNPDIVYFRYNTWSVTLNKIQKKFVSVVELNTIDLNEFYFLFKKAKTLKSFLRYVAYRFLRYFVLSQVNGIVGVTNEIINHDSNKFYNKPSICIPNSIDIDEYKIIKTNKNISKISLFFIGTPNQTWHGVDRIIKISKALPEFDFHIVGTEGKTEKNLFWYGYLDKKEYIEIIKKCHVCIGSLALDRINIKEACPLKVREYMAYGFPIIIGYDDTSFSNHHLPDWILKIDKNFDIKTIKDFIYVNHDKILDEKDLSKISTDVLERERIMFLESFV